MVHSASNLLSDTFCNWCDSDNRLLAVWLRRYVLLLFSVLRGNCFLDQLIRIYSCDPLYSHLSPHQNQTEKQTNVNIGRWTRALPSGNEYPCRQLRHSVPKPLDKNNKRTGNVLGLHVLQPLVLFGTDHQPIPVRQVHEAVSSNNLPLYVANQKEKGKELANQPICIDVIMYEYLAIWICIRYLLSIERVIYQLLRTEPDL